MIGVPQLLFGNLIYCGMRRFNGDQHQSNSSYLFDL